MQQQVKTFMREVKELDLPRHPGIPSKLIRELCIALIQEETEETIDAIRLADGALVDDLSILVEIADGLADSIYVLLYTANAFGIFLEPIFNEVQRSNMTKKGGAKRADGKQLKPALYEPPNIRRIILEQFGATNTET